MGKVNVHRNPILFDIDVEKPIGTAKHLSEENCVRRLREENFEETRHSGTFIVWAKWPSLTVWKNKGLRGQSTLCETYHEQEERHDNNSMVGKVAKFFGVQSGTEKEFFAGANFTDIYVI